LRGQLADLSPEEKLQERERGEAEESDVPEQGRGHLGVEAPGLRVIIVLRVFALHLLRNHNNKA
jgi:hypothetical protein